MSSGLSFNVSKKNPQGYVQSRIIQFDYETRALKNLKKGKVQKTFPFSDIKGVVKNRMGTGLLIHFKSARSYELFLSTEKERDELFNKIEQVIKYSNKPKTPEILKTVYVEKKGKWKWTPRKLNLISGEIHCFRINESYPTVLIQLNSSYARKVESNVIEVIFQKKKFLFRFDNEKQRNEFFQAIIESSPISGSYNVGQEADFHTDGESDEEPQEIGVELVMFKEENPNSKGEFIPLTKKRSITMRDQGSKSAPLSPGFQETRPHSQSLIGKSPQEHTPGKSKFLGGKHFSEIDLKIAEMLKLDPNTVDIPRDLKFKDLHDFFSPKELPTIDIEPSTMNNLEKGTSELKTMNSDDNLEHQSQPKVGILVDLS